VTANSHTHHDEGDRIQEKIQTPSAIANVTGALLSCFLTTTGGISLGTVIFPPGVEQQWLAIGMNIGLLTAFVTSVVLAVATDLPVGVGGTLIPAITVLSDFFANEIGADEPQTILMALAINTFCFGILVALAGRCGFSSAVKACPYAVFVGFLGYTGVSLLVYAVQIADPGFTNKLTDMAGYKTLNHRDTLQQVLPPVVVSITVAWIRRDWHWKPTVLVRSCLHCLLCVWGGTRRHWF
jgi:MFS superfamily sulfate permease-like transporter